MKQTKLAAGLGAAVLAIGTAMVGLSASPAQAVSEDITYYCQITDNSVGTGVGTYAGRSVEITVTPASVSLGQDQTITVNVGGDGAVADGPAIFNNGPIPQGATGAYEAIFIVSVNDGPLTNIKSTTVAAAAAGFGSFFPNGATGAWTNDFAEGVNTVELEGLVFNSNSSGPAWTGTGTETDYGNAFSFDSICSGDSTNPGNNAGAGPPSGGASAENPTGTQPPVPPSLPPANRLNAASTEFTVTGEDPNAPQSTTTTVVADPTGPQPLGTEVTFTAFVEANSGNPAGEVQFKRNGSDLGSPVATEADEDGVSVAEIIVDDLPAGTSSITAEFVSDDDEGPDGFTDSNSVPLNYTIEAASTPTPTPTPTPTVPTSDVSPVSEQGNFDLTCQPFAFAGTDQAKTIKQFPIRVTVTPGAAPPGDLVLIEVNAGASADNSGPTNIEPDRYRFEALVTVAGQELRLSDGSINTVQANSKPAPPYNPIFTAQETADFGLFARGTATTPAAEGPVEVVVNEVIFNNINNGATGTAESITDTFDARCNLSDNPVQEAQSIGLSVTFQSDASAPSTGVTPIDDPETTGGDDDPEGDGESGGALANTGPAELLALGLLAIVALQFGAIFAVRAYRAAPAGRRHV